MTNDTFGREGAYVVPSGLENGGIPYRWLKPPAIRFFPSGEVFRLIRDEPEDPEK